MDKSELNLKLKEAEDAEETENFFAAAFFYRNTLESAIKLQNSKLIKLCKGKIVEMNKRSIASGKDFNEVESRHTLSEENQEALKKIINSILGLNDIKLVLNIIGEHPYFFPKVTEVESQAKKTIPVTYQIATLSTISDQGHNIRGGSDGSYSWFMKMYKLNQELIMDMYLDKIFYMLINNKTKKSKLGLKELENYLSSSGIIEPNQLKIISVGLQRYFEKDYVSALHILVPQFEGVFLGLAQKCGIDIITLDQKMDIATRTKTLSEYHLDSEEFKNVFGEDFCKQIKFILFEPLGYKLRHKIAHGEIKPEECNFRNTNLTIYLYLVLLSRSHTINNE
ncbi:MAG: DUF4209 domain-containing protein [Candidatus Levybacteria bacterium]|nr:DUF4209 domain-containing protein [Candidatus Levybacteria bacterium]